MHKIRVICFACILIFFVPQLYAGTYYVSDNGDAEWSACEHAAAPSGPKSGEQACSLSTANTNALEGDVIYLRAGTYTITEIGINPTNSGSSGNDRITFSGYGSEVVTITGAADATGYRSQGVVLNEDSYIHITKINFTNLFGGFRIHGGSHNEISYCTFTFRDVWADVLETGTAKNDGSNYFQSSSTLYDYDNDLSGYQYRRVYNVTDKSTMYSVDEATATTLVGNNTRVLLGGDDNQWDYGDTYQITFRYPYDPAVCDIGGSSTHNYIHHNSMHGTGGFLEGQDGVPVFQIGSDVGSPEFNNNNTIEHNHVYHGGHHVMGMNKGRYNVLRHNYLHNEAWFDDSSYSGNCYEKGLCGYRVVVSVVDEAYYGGHNLWENNRIGYGDAYGGTHLVPGGASGSGVTLATPGNIYRYNAHFGNALFGLRFGGSMGNLAVDNRIFNNTFYHNGYREGPDSETYDAYRSGLYFYGTGTTGGVIINNLFYDHWAQTNRDTGSSYWPALVARDSDVANNTITNNYVNSSSDYWASATPIDEMEDPLFTDPDITDPLSTTKPDLTLQINSPAIDGGTSLTQAIGAGSNTTVLIVEDARYFQDGSWGSDLTETHADWIAIGEVTNTVQIDAIDYNTNTITLAAEASWDDNDEVWLYKNSDGDIVLAGDSPDMGAHEFGTGTEIPDPASGGSSGSSGGCFIGHLWQI